MYGFGSLQHDPDEPFCTSGKRGFRSEELAQKALATVQWLRRNDPDSRSNRPRTECEVYECRTCRWWHMSSTPHKSRRSSYVYKCRKSGRR
jgi:hypothetical protein